MKISSDAIEAWLDSLPSDLSELLITADDDVTQMVLRPRLRMSDPRLRQAFFDGVDGLIRRGAKQVRVEATRRGITLGSPLIVEGRVIRDA